MGFAAKHRLSQLISAGDITVIEERQFQENAAAYMEQIASYLSSHLPFDDDFLECVQWISPTTVIQSDSTDMLSCANR